MAKKLLRPGDKERLAKARAAAGLPEIPAAPKGPRAMVQLQGGTTIEATGEVARDYPNETGTRKQIREVAGASWRQTPVPVDPNNIYDVNAAKINAYEGRFGVNQNRRMIGNVPDALNNKITAEAARRLDPNNVQDVLERLRTEGVVTGGPNLDPGETMPTGAYGQMLREESARRAADKTGRVQYVRPPEGSRDIARWMSPGQPVDVETIRQEGAPLGSTGNIRMTPTDAQAYRAATDQAYQIKNALGAALKKVADGDPDTKMLQEQVIPYLKQREEETIAGLRDMAGELQKRQPKEGALPIPASDMSPGAGIPQRELDELSRDWEYTTQQKREMRRLEEAMATTEAVENLSDPEKADGIAQIKAKMAQIRPAKRKEKAEMLEGDPEGSVKSMGGHFYQVQRDFRTKKLIRKKLGPDESQKSHADKQKDEELDIKRQDIALKAATVLGEDGSPRIDWERFGEIFRRLKGGEATQQAEQPPEPGVVPNGKAAGAGTGAAASPAVRQTVESAMSALEGGGSWKDHYDTLNQNRASLTPADLARLARIRQKSKK